MKFGTKVLVVRGSNHHAKNLRLVPGTLIGARGKHDRLIRIEVDDRRDLAFTKAGSKRWFSTSCIIQLDKINYVPFL